MLIIPVSYQMPPAGVESGDVDENRQGGESKIIALYYKYIDLSGSRAEVARFYEEHCSALGLQGRVRVASDGVNACLGGPADRIARHIAAIKEHPVILGEDIDFKLAPSDGARNGDCQRETGFDRLRVIECDEVVTLGAVARGGKAALDMTATHVLPQLFHDELNRAIGRREGSEVVLLDARNVYESRIGFFGPEGVAVVRPCLRQFSDLPSWLDSAEAEAQLKDRRVLMYCTGGVRCERASAYLRSKGPGFQDVLQLQGGIQRYLDEFPDGGYFRGKNFVFDERVAVGPPCGPVVGQCLRCHVAWDDYGARHRCATCRMLVLLCPTCALACRPTAEGEGPDPTPLCCEVCSERRRRAGPGRGKRRGRKAGGAGGSKEGEDGGGQEPRHRPSAMGTPDPKGRRRREEEGDAEAALDGLQCLIGALEEGS